MNLDCSGIKLNSPVHLDGGGVAQKSFFAELIKSTGKQKYSRGFEWCAGLGAIGYELLGSKIVDHIVFSDNYAGAITDCLETANSNGIDADVTTYISSRIADIPQHEQWDLVVGNPPHYPNLAALQNILTRYGYNLPKTTIDNTLRLTADGDWKIHQEFFDNIRSHITADADIYLSEEQTDEILVTMAEAGGLYLVKIHPIPTLKLNIYHFKPATISPAAD